MSLDDKSMPYPVDNLSSLLETGSLLRVLSVDERDGDNTVWAGYLSDSTERSDSPDTG